MMKAHRLAALAAVLIVGAVTPVQAVQVPVSYTTSGQFGASNSNTLVRDGVTITYNSFTSNYVLDTVLLPSSAADFGSFTITGTANAIAQFNAAGLADRFTLTIDQNAPVPTPDAPPNNPISFSSQISGTIFFGSGGGGSSNAFLQFDPNTLTQTIVGSPSITYRLVEGDDASAGRVRLFTGTGSNITGNISIAGTPAAIPEPGTMALACAALPLLGLGYVRSRRRNA